ncbi:MAG: cation transporter [Propionibacteriaceae bacterium]|jgi:copper chaperone CopZ|nr:cation transporter [Propionibacteriaceae bacterium]
MGISTYQVKGISCGHCVAAIKEEVGAIPGVTEVALDTTGVLQITSDAPVDAAALQAALAEAGDDYALA